MFGPTVFGSVARRFGLFSLLLGVNTPIILGCSQRENNGEAPHHDFFAHIDVPQSALSGQQIHLDASSLLEVSSVPLVFSWTAPGTRIDCQEVFGNSDSARATFTSTCIGVRQLALDVQARFEEDQSPENEFHTEFRIEIKPSLEMNIRDADTEKTVAYHCNGDECSTAPLIVEAPIRDAGSADIVRQYATQLFDYSLQLDDGTRLADATPLANEDSTLKFQITRPMGATFRDISQVYLVATANNQGIDDASLGLSFGQRVSAPLTMTVENQAPTISMDSNLNLAHSYSQRGYEVALNLVNRVTDNENNKLALALEHEDNSFEVLVEESNIVFIFDEAQDLRNSHTATLVVSDPEGLTAQHTFIFNVLNTAPTITPDTIELTHLYDETLAQYCFTLGAQTPHRNPRAEHLGLWSSDAEGDPLQLTFLRYECLLEDEGAIEFMNDGELSCSDRHELGQAQWNNSYARFCFEDASIHKEYRFQARVSDGMNESEESELRLRITNQAPELWIDDVMVIGEGLNSLQELSLAENTLHHQTVQNATSTENDGFEVHGLEGAQIQDPNGDPMDFVWKLEDDTLLQNISTRTPSEYGGELLTLRPELSFQSFVSRQGVLDGRLAVADAFSHQEISTLTAMRLLNRVATVNRMYFAKDALSLTPIEALSLENTKTTNIPFEENFGPGLPPTFINNFTYWRPWDDRPCDNPVGGLCITDKNSGIPVRLVLEVDNPDGDPISLALQSGNCPLGSATTVFLGKPKSTIENFVPKTKLTRVSGDVDFNPPLRSSSFDATQRLVSEFHVTSSRNDLQCIEGSEERWTAFNISQSTTCSIESVGGGNLFMGVDAWDPLLTPEVEIEDFLLTPQDTSEDQGFCPN